MIRLQTLALLLVIFLFFSCTQQGASSETQPEKQDRNSEITIEGDQLPSYFILYDSNFRQGWSRDIGRIFDSILIGYWEDGSWKSDDTNFPPNDQEIVLYSPMMEPHEASISDAFFDVSLGGPFMALDFTEDTEDLEGKMIGLNANWNILPRPIEVLSENLNYVLMDIRLYGSEQLQSISMDVLKMISTDLDGNGGPEIVCLTKVFAPVYDSNAESEVPGADWAILIIERSDEDEVRVHQLDEIILGPDWHLANAEIWCLDLNGDGSMEIVEARDYYEFHSYNVYTFDGDKFENVTSNGFGV